MQGANARTFQVTVTKTQQFSTDWNSNGCKISPKSPSLFGDSISTVSAINKTHKTQLTLKLNQSNTHDGVRDIANFLKGKPTIVPLIRIHSSSSLSPLSTPQKKEKSTYQKLEEIENKIKEIEKYTHDYQQQQRRFIGNLLLYGIGSSVIAFVTFYFAFLPDTLEKKILYSIPILSLPILWVVQFVLLLEDVNSHSCYL